MKINLNNDNKEPIERRIKMQEPTIEEIEKELGLDNVMPIILTPSDTEEFKEKNNPFKEWYEDELQKLYRSFHS